MRKTITMLFLSMLAALPMAAQDDKDLVVETKAGTSQTFNISGIQRLDFSNQGVTVVSKDKDGTTFAFDDIKKITFVSAANGISQIKTEGATSQSIFISNDGNSLTVKGMESRPVCRRQHLLCGRHTRAGSQRLERPDRQHLCFAQRSLCSESGQQDRKIQKIILISSKSHYEDNIYGSPSGLLHHVQLRPESLCACTPEVGQSC